MDTKIMRAELQAQMTNRSNIEQTWEYIQRFIMPYRGNFFQEVNQESSVNWRTGRNIYDSTAVVACQTLAASLHASLTSMAVRWFDLRWGRKELNDDETAHRWMENAAGIVYEAIQNSNFDLEASETYLDIVGFGSSIIFEEVTDEGEGDVNFMSVPVQQGYPIVGHDGQCERFYRVFNWTPSEIYSKFGDDTPSKYREMHESGKNDERHKIVFAIWKRKDKKSNEGRAPLAGKERYIGYKYFEFESCDQIGEEQGYYEMPVFIPRWRRTNDSQWGNGPAMVALPDVMTLNALVEMVLQAAEKVIDPANLVRERDLISDLDLSAGGMTVVRDIEGVKPYESRARFDVSQLRIGELQSSINRVFYVDQLELKDSPAMTATEVQVRYELMQRLLGPTLGRMKTDFLDPLIQRTFNAKYRAGKLGELPPGATIDDIYAVEYTGPFARAQKIDTARSAMEWLAYLAQVAELYPEALDIPDIDNISRGLAKLTSVPIEFIKNETKVKTERKKRQEQQQAQQQAMMAEQQSKAELNMAKAEGQQ